MKLTETQERVLELIPNGKNNAIHGRELESYTGYSSMTVKHAIRQLRQEYPICSGRPGYWMGSKDDMNNLIGEQELKLNNKGRLITDLSKVERGMV